MQQEEPQLLQRGHEVDGVPQLPLGRLLLPGDPAVEGVGGDERPVSEDLPGGVGGGGDVLAGVGVVSHSVGKEEAGLDQGLEGAAGHL